MLFWISSQAAESAEDASTKGSWRDAGTYSCCTGGQHEIPGLEFGSSYAIRAILIDESGDSYNGTDVQKAVYRTMCNRKLE